MKFGTTYSHRHIAYLGLDNSESFQKLLDFGFDIIRLGCYWDEIEKSRGTFDFSAITSLLDNCERVKQKVLITVGMKAPRFPEFYIPHWIYDENEINERVITFIQQTVNKFSSYKCIEAWQVENEPLHRSGPLNKVIPIDLLIEETKIIRSMDKRDIVINYWGNDAVISRNIFKIERFADIIGLDIYFKVPGIFGKHWGPLGGVKPIKYLIKNIKKPVWITELQAEPWEKNEIVTKNPNPKSISPDLIKTNFNKTLELKPEIVFFWGYEYWIYRSREGDNSYLKTIADIIQSYKIVN